MILLTAIPMAFGAGLIVAGFAVLVAFWLFMGWLMDKYDAWRTDNWRGWK